MSKFLFVSSFDSRRNTSGNIRLVALMKALHDCGHIVHCLFSPTDKESDIEIFEALSTIDRIVTYPSVIFEPVPKSTNFTSSKRPNLKTRLSRLFIKFYTPLTVYDVYKLKVDRVSKSDLSALDEDYDYIISSAEPRSSHIFAERIIKIKQYKSKWIMYWGDPMTNDVASNRLFSDREIKEERRLISISDISLYTNPCAVSYMKEKYKDLEEKIDWIPTTDFRRDIDSCEKGDINKIGYFGDYRQKYRNLTPFYKACCENNLSATIIGSADQPFDSTSTVSVYGRMSRAEIERYEQSCGILIVLENICKTANCIQVPGKLYHYGLTHKYILVITESKNIAEEYKKYDRFIFVPNDKNMIAEAIKNIQSGSYTNLKIAPLEEFMYDRIVEKLIKIIA